MGKTNKANRTKGNTRPSSSEHSAQLLSSSGKSFSGFIGFEALEKEIPCYIPVTGQHSDADLSVDSDLRMVMRKMLKRDSITRLKAIQEFGDLCSEKEKDIVKNVLPFWPRLFNKLALDYDRRIREATHQANGKLIANVKREIAPYLKNIMGVWLLGQNDLHAPAASAAQATFAATFPTSKQSEALMHCKNEIFSYFKDNLFEQTAKSLSENSFASAEDIENKYTLVISATLQAMKLFLVTISPNDISNVHNDYLSIVSEGKFWKYAKNKEVQIRGSWYGLISFLCHLKPDLFHEMEKKLTAAVFGSLSENDPIVAPNVWESALRIVTNFDNCWQGISIHKVVLPQLWTLLNEGGRGCAHVLFPCILPFFSKFPKEVLSKDTFLSQVFSCLRHSLTLDCVKSSSMECDAVLTTFVECLQYFSFVILDKIKDGPALLEKNISDHILPLIEASFYDVKYRHLPTSKFYPLIGSLIRGIENKCLSESENTPKSYLQSLNLFWNGISVIFNKFFDKRDEEKSKITVFITYFFHSVLSASAILSKSEKNKVKFEDEKIEENVKLIPSSNTPVDLYKKMPITFTHIINFIKLLCDKNIENVNIYHVKILDEILVATLSPQFLKDILKSFMSSDNNEMKATEFFDQIIFKWILNSNFNKSSIDCIVDIIFSLCSSVSENEALEILNACCMVTQPVLLDSILNKGLGMYINEPVLQKWLRCSQLMTSIINEMKMMMESITKDDKEKVETKVLAQKNLLLTCLLNKNFQGILCENKWIEVSLITCKDYMERGLKCQNADYFFEITCNLIEIIAENWEICWKYSVMDDLLSLMFHWNLNVEKSGISDKSCSILSKCWYSSVTSLCKSSNKVLKNNSFILKASKELNFALTNHSAKQSTKILNEILKLLNSVEKALGSIQDYSSAYILRELLDNILPSESQWESLKEGLALSSVPLFLQKKILHPLPKEGNFKISPEVTSTVFMTTSIVLQVFVKELESHITCEDEQYFEQYIIKYMPQLLWCVSYFKGSGYLNEDFDMNIYSVKALEEYISKILIFLTPDDLQTVLKDIYSRFVSEGIKWVFTFQLFQELTSKLSSVKTALPNILKSGDILDTNEHNSLTTQILSSYISEEEKIFELKKLLEDFLKNCNETSNIVNNDDLKKIAKICCILKDVDSFNEELRDLLSCFMDNILCYDCEIDCKALFSFQISTIIASIIHHVPELVTKQVWDYTQTLLSSNIKECKYYKFNKPSDFILLFQVSSLYSSSFTFIQSNSKESAWQPCVSDDINEEFICLFIYVGGAIRKFKPLFQVFEITFNELLTAVHYIPEQAIYNYLTCSTTKKPTEKEGKSLETPFESLLRILSESDILYLKVAVHLMLMKFMPRFSKSLENISRNETDDNENEDDKIPARLQPLVDVLNLLNELMETMLWDFKIGDCCIILPNTEAYAFVLAYMFAWLQMLEFISSSSAQVRSGYVAGLEEAKLLSSLLSNIFRLMPENPLSCFTTFKHAESPKKENLVSLFFHLPEILPGNPSSEQIQTIACFVFSTALRRVPASVRTWFNNLDKTSAEIVNRFTTKYISGIICAEEIKSVQSNENLFKNMVVKARMGSREIVATYAVDDSSIELCLQLPINYPLSPIIPEKKGKMVVSQLEFRQWIMQMTTAITYQNGSILDGLNIWKKNLDKKFEGVEECMICYYVLHNSSGKLPKLSCHVCKKKFHNICLYTWFRSSNNFTCPLCRNEFVI